MLKGEIGLIDDFSLGILYCLSSCVSLDTLVVNSLEVIAYVFPLIMEVGEGGFSDVFPALSTIGLSGVPEGSEVLVPENAISYR